MDSLILFYPNKSRNNSNTLLSNIYDNENVEWN